VRGSFGGDLRLETDLAPNIQTHRAKSYYSFAGIASAKKHPILVVR
jgi:hypothetical protein